MGFVFELAVLTLLMASGISAGYLLGLRGMVLIPAGLALSVAIRVVSYSFLELTGLAEAGFVVWLSLSVLILLLGLVRHFSAREIWLWIGLGSLAGLVSAGITRGLGLRGIPHSDSLWIFTLSDLIQRAGDLEIVGGRTAIKRGFSFPLVLSLGPQGEILSGFIVLIFIALVLAAIWAVRSLAPSLSAKQWVWILVPVAILVLSAPIIGRSVLYLNGHTLTALGMTLATTAVVLAVRDQNLTRQNLILISLGLMLISTTRVEGVALAAIIAAPLISRRWLSRSDVRFIVGSSLLSFGLWVYVYGAFIATLLRLYDERFLVVVILATFLVGLKIFDFIRFRLVALAAIGMAALLAVALFVNFEGLLDDIGAQFENMFLGAGFWGSFFIGLIPTLIAIGRKGMSTQYQTLLTISLLLFAGSFVAKLMDGGLVGEPTLGRVGWTDSLNRMWLHVFAIFLVTAIVGLAERIKALERISA